MKFDRAWRRAQTARLKKKRRNYWYVGEKSPRTLGLLLNTAKPCGCWMCSNARKVFGKPFDQIRAELVDAETYLIDSD